jgi:hypothetical protein
MDTNANALAADESLALPAVGGELGASYVNGDVIAKWQAAHTKATTRHSAASNALKDATMAEERAAVAYNLALEGKGDAHAARDALDAATKAKSVCQHSFDAAVKAVALSNERRQLARGVAHKPLYLYGVRLRIEAAQRGDEAREMLAKAERAYRDATNVLLLAMRNGHPDIHGATAQQTLQSAAAERHHWASRGVDHERGVHPWDPGPISGDDE